MVNVATTTTTTVKLAAVSEDYANAMASGSAATDVMSLSHTSTTRAVRQPPAFWIMSKQQLNCTVAVPVKLIPN